MESLGGINRSTDMNITKTLMAFEEDDAWLHKQLENEKFQDEFENKFVAVKDKQVIASAKKVDELIKDIENKKVNLSETFVEFVYPKDAVIIF